MDYRSKCLKESRKRNYEKYKAQTLKRKAEKITCNCGAIVCVGGISIHKRSQKHKKSLVKL